MMSGLTRVQNGNFPILETNELDLVYALTHCQYELLASVSIMSIFFFQAEDGIRDIGVTGVQTCALPISRPGARRRRLDGELRLPRALEAGLRLGPPVRGRERRRKPREAEARMSTTIERRKNHVGGEWVDAVEGATEEVLNPATGEVIAEVPHGSQADVDRAVDAAKRAFPEWRETTPQERSEALLALAAALDEHADELRAVETANTGKPQSVVYDEIPVSADNLRFFAGAARCLEGKAAGEYMRGYTSMIRDRKSVV